MHRLSLLALLLFCIFKLNAQNPHGENLIIDCKDCHNSDSWSINRAEISFNHASTGFILEGQHTIADCIDCHENLVFENAQDDCVSCHQDVHSMSVGNDCIRCHDASNWLVDNIPEIHEQVGFPLVAAHGSLSCVDCHTSETLLRWDRIGNDCVSCHLNDFNTATEPDHIAAGFSTDCTSCHEPNSDEWGNANFHFFFPLVGVHDIPDCNACHTTGDFFHASSECVSCHMDDYNNAQSVNHQILNLSTDCTQCHTTDPDWRPAKFDDHDGEFFPIYSGKHQGVWNECVDCHINVNNYKDDSCIICHNDQNDLADEHKDEPDYIFDNDACFFCHPTGEK